MANIKIIDWVVSFVLFLCIIGACFCFNSYRLLSKSMNQEKLTSEKILSEKLALQKQADIYQNQIKLITKNYNELDKVLYKANNALKEREFEIKKIDQTNVEFTDQISRMAKMNKDVEDRVKLLDESNKKLIADNNLLSQNNISMRSANETVARNANNISSVRADNYLIETMGRKNKLTVMARRTRTMNLSFKVPENKTQNISFIITNPDGKINGIDNGISYKVVEANNLMASNSTEKIKSSKKIEMKYEPKEKLKPGVYNIEIINDGNHISACNIKLR